MFSSVWCTYQMSIRYTAGVCWQSRYEWEGLKYWYASKGTRVLVCWTDQSTGTLAKGLAYWYAGLTKVMVRWQRDSGTDTWYADCWQHTYELLPEGMLSLGSVFDQTKLH
jgi:hypothetical protein